MSKFWNAIKQELVCMYFMARGVPAQQAAVISDTSFTNDSSLAIRKFIADDGCVGYRIRIYDQTGSGVVDGD